MEQRQQEASQQLHVINTRTSAHTHTYQHSCLRVEKRDNEKKQERKRE
jgi:hypothetical protein